MILAGLKAGLRPGELTGLRRGTSISSPDASWSGARSHEISLERRRTDAPERSPRRHVPEEWRPYDDWSFDLGGGVTEYVEYEPDAQWEPEAQRAWRRVPLAR